MLKTVGPKVETAVLLGESYHMQAVVLMLLLLGTSTVGYGQGQFVFNNRIGTEVNARFIDCRVDPSNGLTSSVGSPDWKVQLWGGPTGTPVGLLVALEPFETTFRGPAGSPLAGWVESIAPTVSGVLIGGSADVLVRLLGPGGFTLDWGPYTVAGLGGGPLTPPNLQLGTSPLVCLPEPSAFALGFLGIIGVLMTAIVRKRDRFRRIA